MNWLGLAVGFAAFLLIGVFHPVVVKLEYYYGQRFKMPFILVGIVLVCVSLFLPQIISIFVGSLGFTLVWTAFEISEQSKRVAKGQAKKNEKRTIN